MWHVFSTRTLSFSHNDSSIMLIILEALLELSRFQNMLNDKHNH